jgi:hypothetical protein
MYAFPTGEFGIPGYRISKTQPASGSYPGSQQTKGPCFWHRPFLFGNFLDCSVRSENSIALLSLERRIGLLESVLFRLPLVR